MTDPGPADSADRTRDLTRMYQQLGPDDSDRAAQLLPLVYDELRSLARARMATERPDHTIQATALVHEALLRLVAREDPGWNGRRHFFGAAAEAMRRILVEHARRAMAETALAVLSRTGGSLPLEHAEAAAVLAECAHADARLARRMLRELYEAWAKPHEASRYADEP